MDKNLIITDNSLQNSGTTNGDNGTTTPINVGYIKVLNNGGFYCYFSLKYTIDGETFTNSTNGFPYQSKAEIRFPKEATNIELTIKMAVFIGTWQTVLTKTFPTVVQQCYMVYGSVFDPKCVVVQCPVGDNGGGNGDTNPDVPTPPSFNPCCCPCCPCCSCCPCCTPCHYCEQPFNKCCKCCKCNPMNPGSQMMNYPTSYNYNW
ncbi:hypothetical protein [Hathewaya limosa]|uniref:Uncharacterized protein n=1 Tax=Hathewaya limosa TaxID=1536 RepID=A0ABU0JPD5_HATLI|nr:hypothetical protein [Hathewaya limosa]MDQ0478933.1 hypothetical protein [Hathewaya limosa]